MMTDPKTTPVIAVRHVAGVRFTATVKGHTIVTDQPLRAGGTDAGPTPLDLLGVALASCIALYVSEFCRARDIATDGLVVQVAQQLALEPKRIGRYDVTVTLPPDFPAQYRRAVEVVARSCPAHNTLRHAPVIDITMSAAPEPEALTR